MVETLYGIASSALIPPVGLLLLSIFALLITLRYRRVGMITLAAALFGLVALAVPVISQLLIGSLESNLDVQPSPTDPPQAIVLLGGDMSRNAPPSAPFGVGPLSLERERAAAIVARRTGLPILVTGGSLAPGSAPIGALMAQSLTVDFGVRPRWIETSARDTWENAELSAAILIPYGITAIYLVTHAWHMKRAILAFRHFGIRVVAAPTNIRSRIELAPNSFVPRANAWLDSYYALHEWIGYGYYRIRGR
jgi:uncharacterized SAM-binding protein YcdF (DUF218 family)